MAKSVGRPVTKTGAAAAKKRAAAKKAYRAKPLSERKAIVQNRDKDAQRKADAKRLSKSKGERTAYHREQARARAKAPPKPKTCQWPGCSRSDKLQWHHQGTNDKFYCPTHHAMARAKAKGVGSG